MTQPPDRDNTSRFRDPGRAVVVLSAVLLVALLVNIFFPGLSSHTTTLALYALLIPAIMIWFRRPKG